MPGIIITIAYKITCDIRSSNTRSILVATGRIRIMTACAPILFACHQIAIGIDSINPIVFCPIVGIINTIKSPSITMTVIANRSGCKRLTISKIDSSIIMSRTGKKVTILTCTKLWAISCWGKMRSMATIKVRPCNTIRWKAMTSGTINSKGILMSVA